MQVSPEEMIMRVRDVMKSPVQSIRPSDTMGTALRMMQQHGIRHLPVLEDSNLVGIVSDRDLRSPSIPGRWHAVPWSDSIEVEWVMSSPVMVLSSDASLSAAAKLMHSERIDCAPVVDEGKLVGIITSADLLQVIGMEAEAASNTPN
jgi:acetoin utilization protein AcuB